jgi:hypothetical protein
VQRVLDLDLDFFVQPVKFRAVSGDLRLDPASHEVCVDPDTTLRSVDVQSAAPAEAMAYLRERLRLDRPLPGAAVEHHKEVFEHWRRRVAAGTLRPPFHVTHVDAHADFGMFQATYYDIHELLGLDGAARPARSSKMVTDGDWLAHALAARWLGEFDYVYCPGGGVDILTWYIENLALLDWNAGARGALRMYAFDEATLNRPRLTVRPPTDYTEPAVPFCGVRQAEYAAEQPFDFVFLARSPEFTPATADPLYDAIRAAFIV